MTVLYGTGFEAGSAEIVPSADLSHAGALSIESLSKKTGNFAARVNTDATPDRWVRFAINTSSVVEIYATIWLRPSGLGKGFGFEAEYNDNTLVGVRKESGVGNTLMHAYVDGSNVASGSVPLDTSPVDDFQLFELYVKLASSGGRIVLKFNELTSPNAIDIDYTGNTNPTTASEINYIRFSIFDAAADFMRIDNLTVRSDAWPGDIRYINQIPGGDNTVAWTPSAGTDNYALVDEITPDDADYVESSTNNQRDLYDIDDYSPATSGISHVVQWVRASTSVSGGEVAMVCLSGSTVSTETSSGLGTTIGYVSRILVTDPNTGFLWTATGFDAALFGQDAIVTTETIRVYQHILETAFIGSGAYPDGVSFQTPFNYIEDQGAGASGGAGGSAEGIASVNSADSQIYIAAFNSLELPILIKISTDLTSGGSIVFQSADGGRIGVKCERVDPNSVWIYGEFDGTNVIEKSEDAGQTWTVKDNGSMGTIRALRIGPWDDDRLIVFDGDNGDILESTNGGTTWTTINASVTPLVNDIDRYVQNFEETVIINQGGVTNSIDYSPNSGVNLEDYQTGVYPNANGTVVIVL